MSRTSTSAIELKQKQPSQISQSRHVLFDGEVFTPFSGSTLMTVIAAGEASKTNINSCCKNYGHREGNMLASRTRGEDLLFFLILSHLLVLPFMCPTQHPLMTLISNTGP